LCVVPLENEDVNECWIADRDRFSYESLNSDESLTQPMLKQGGQWQAVDWQTALEYVANGLRQIKTDHGASAIGALVSPHSTVEELALASSLVRGLGSDNIDYRLRNADFTPSSGIRWLGTSIASLSQLQRVLVVGSNLRKDHPLFAQRIRQAARKGAAVHSINSSVELASRDAWAMSIAGSQTMPSSDWARALGNLATAIGAEKGVSAPAAGEADDAAKTLAKSLMGGERKAILLGNAAAHHPQASQLLATAQWIGEQTGATVGYLTEAANTVGAQWVGATPRNGGLNAAQMLKGGLKAVLLLNNEPEFDSAIGANAPAGLEHSQMVVTLSPFKANLAFSDVLLPIAPFTETPGTFVNAEGRVQSFHAVVKPLGGARPAWKVLRVLGNMLGLQGFDFESSQEVLAHVQGVQDAASTHIPAGRPSNAAPAGVELSAAADGAGVLPAVAAIYQLDGLVRRATSLQLTADARGQAVRGSAPMLDGVSA